MKLLGRVLALRQYPHLCSQLLAVPDKFLASRTLLQVFTRRNRDWPTVFGQDQLLAAFMAGHGDFTPCGPYAESCRRSSCRARASRDATVPSGQSRISAISVRRTRSASESQTTARNASGKLSKALLTSSVVMSEGSGSTPLSSSTSSRQEISSDIPRRSSFRR